MRRYSVLAIAVLFLTMVCFNDASAQLSSRSDFTVSFEFYAGNTKLPAGKYSLTPSNDDNFTLWELKSDDEKLAVYLEAHDAPSGAPKKSSVVFKKYDGKLFLYQVFEAGNATGIELNIGQPEQRVAKSGATPTKHSVDATSSKAAKKTP